MSQSFDRSDISCYNNNPDNQLQEESEGSNFAPSSSPCVILRGVEGSAPDCSRGRQIVGGRYPYLPLYHILLLPLDFIDSNIEVFNMVIRKRLNLSQRAMVFVTTTVKDWVSIFSNENCALLTLNQLHETLSHYRVSLIAYVLMPSHIHLLLGFHEIENLSLVIQSFKRLTARKLKPFIQNNLVHKFMKDEKYNLWKPRFDDLIIWSEKQFKIKIEYIHNNPVKAGLVEKPTDYVYSSINDWLLEREGILPVDKDWDWLKEKVN